MVLPPTHVVPLDMTPVVFSVVQRVLMAASLQGASCRLRAKLVQTGSAPPQIVSTFCLYLVVAYDGRD